MKALLVSNQMANRLRKPLLSSYPSLSLAQFYSVFKSIVTVALSVLTVRRFNKERLLDFALENNTLPMLWQ
jgi:hypothetical protein